VRLFEFGTIFAGSPAAVHERTGLALGLTGDATATPLHKAEDALFFAAKGALESLLHKFSGQITFDTNELPAWLEPGRGARALLSGTPVAIFGELASAEAQRRKLRQTCVLATVEAHLLLATPLRAPAIRELSRFQAVERDFSFIFPDSVHWNTIQGVLHTLTLPELHRTWPVEIYRAAKGNEAAGSYSLLLRTVFQSTTRTLTEDELTTWSDQIVAQLTLLGGTQRA
jgi:phenylalanyl-tRNA synthetase beta chain